MDTIDEILLPLRMLVKEQGDAVRDLKAAGSDQMTIKAAVQELKRRKATLQDKELELTAGENKFDKEAFDTACKRRFLFGQSFDIYGGVSGLYDYGPVGCTLKNNILNIWRELFVAEEDMLEIEASMLTPKTVLDTSGHTALFQDLMVTDVKTGEFHRADHLFESFLEKLIKSDRFLEMPEEERKQVKVQLTSADNYNAEELANFFKHYEIKSPTTGNDLNPPVEFNLMFQSSIGPGGDIPAFLRPETAQGIFVNYPRLAAFNNGKLPFGCAQIGHAFRNEISPRNGLVRVREFQMAEIEYFLDPVNKNHEKFESVAHLTFPMLSSKRQCEGLSAINYNLGQAVREKMIDNESLGYFIGRIYLFAIRIGLDPKRLRFRQHLENEMAHYACDCWDLEIQVSSGWIEAVGCADRSCYDLTCHAKATNTNIIAKRRLDKPQQVDLAILIPNKKTMGKDFKKNAGLIQKYLADLPADQAEALYNQLQSEKSISMEAGKGLAESYELKLEHITKLDKKTKTVHEVDFVPTVIEPSFGIGRLFYSLLEHTFKIREKNEEDKKDDKRTYFSLPAAVTPYKCSVMRLLGHAEYDPLMANISKMLKLVNLSHKVDDVRGISIGKRYARTDEIAIPFGITVDGESVEKARIATLGSDHGDEILSKTSQVPNAGWSVTVRERDSMTQVRVPIENLSNLLVELCNGEKTWDQIYDKEFPAYGS